MLQKVCPQPQQQQPNAYVTDNKNINKYCVFEVECGLFTAAAGLRTV
jgi:hypothetical protein